MPLHRLMRWVARWLEERGLGDVADTLDVRVAAASGDVEAMHAVARRALERGDVALALSQVNDALKVSPRDARLWCTLGAVHRRKDDSESARQAYERALALNPAYPQALSNLGELCIARGEAEKALDWFEKALACSPGFFEARLNRVAALFELARYDDARVAGEQLVADEPARAEAHLNLGNVLIHTGKAKQGIVHYKKALELKPGYPEAHFNLATLVGSRDDLGSAIGYLERLVRERGDSIHSLGMLAAAHQAAGHLTESERLCRRILERQCDNIAALVTLGSCLSTGGNSEAALPLYERVVELDGNQSGMASNLLFECNNLEGLDREEVFRRHREWAERFETPLLGEPDFSIRDRDPGRKLRIGYVSADFTRHPVGFLLRDVLRHHDAENFEIHCFSMVVRGEEVLPELREAADSWQEIFFLSDEEVADAVREAEVDILIDLSGHTAFNRLLAFARRPAPVQVEWIGYFHSTGLRSIDYFITDPHTTPADSGQLFSEIPLFLPHSRFCYGPPDYTPAVAPPPSEKSGVITFGSFNRLSKVTDAVVEAWSRILLRIPTARLLIKSGALAEPAVAERLRARFERHGIAGERLELREGSAHAEMFRQYGDVDIALDTFPFNGGMTTLEALWMGVPVVTVAGDTVVSRQTVSALANIGLDDQFAFADVDAYIAGAAVLAGDPARLVELRRELRPRMQQSAICQPERFTRDLEALYRRMWRAWCAGDRLPSDIDGNAAVNAPGVRYYH